LICLQSFVQDQVCYIIHSYLRLLYANCGYYLLQMTLERGVPQWPRNPPAHHTGRNYLAAGGHCSDTARRLFAR
jgi:hypothetical protein